MGLFTETTLNYVPGGAALDGRPTPVEIHDGRSASLPGWETCGFELLRHQSAVTDWDDDDHLAQVHYAEIEALARRLTGAPAALVTSHIRRSPEAAKRHHQFSPITFVHSDFAESYLDVIHRLYRGGDATPQAAAALARNGLTPDDVAGARRLLILQFWRNLGPAKMDFPLAFLDARTVSRDQARAFRVTNYGGSGVDFDALAIVKPRHPSEHGWYTFPELQRDEVVAFRTFDTDLVKRGDTYFTPHSAFRDPDVQEGRPARHSIELRATCLWS